MLMFCTLLHLLQDLDVLSSSEDLVYPEEEPDLIDGNRMLRGYLRPNRPLRPRPGGWPQRPSRPRPGGWPGGGGRPSRPRPCYGRGCERPSRPHWRHGRGK